ncbi:BSD domain protein [Schizosaccharomyces osmophilus]|uniref:BSD domain protein n=1 Tax=Schizosaccharomyces osmophilus TaxID=2545709 RepID=A0AAE9W9I3_9SCHI|nr:BSD domain protein [Schizosaccharomyces osmophilus]WBW72161.1 BSD domain protein [Schizosaccharomyces osmophilus]
MDLYDYMSPNATTEEQNEEGYEKLKEEMGSALDSLTGGKFGPFWSKFKEKGESFIGDTRERANTGVSNLKAQFEEGTSSGSTLENIRKVEESAGRYWNSFGTTVNGFLDKALQVTPKEEEESRLSRSKSSRASLFLSRQEKQILRLIENSDLFRNPVSDEGYKDWEKEISIDSKTDEISGLLQTYESLRNQMEQLVPSQVSYDAFWKRFFWYKEGIRPTKSMSSIHNEEEIFSWDDEKSDVEEEKADKDTSKRKEEVSKDTKDELDPEQNEKKSATSTPSVSHADEKVTPETPTTEKDNTKPNKGKDNDEDDDWE